MDEVIASQEQNSDISIDMPLSENNKSIFGAKIRYMDC